jgi:hypothetical protein
MLCFLFGHTSLHSLLESSSCVHIDDSNDSCVITFHSNKSFGLVDKSQEVERGTTVVTIHSTCHDISVGNCSWVVCVTRMDRQGFIQNTDWEHPENLKCKRESE